jgi:hypothetical protein
MTIGMSLVRYQAKKNGAIGSAFLANTMEQTFCERGWLLDHH